MARVARLLLAPVPVAAWIECWGAGLEQGGNELRGHQDGGLRGRGGGTHTQSARKTGRCGTLGAGQLTRTSGLKCRASPSGALALCVYL